jgi:hypothetical protein
LPSPYIEVFPANALAFPDDIQQAHAALLTPERIPGNRIAQTNGLLKAVTLAGGLLLASCGAVAAPAALAPSSPASSVATKPAASGRDRIGASKGQSQEASSPEGGRTASAAAPQSQPASQPASPAALRCASLTLGPARQLFHKGQPDAFGMGDVPDQQPAALRQPDGSYLVFLNGRIAGMPAQDNAGNVALFSTKDSGCAPSASVSELSG